MALGSGRRSGPPSPGWFECDTPRHEAEGRYLLALRRAVQSTPAFEGLPPHTHLLDDWTGDLVNDLTVAGVEASPEEFAGWTAGWFAWQLRRPLYRDDWAGPRLYSVWRFGDTQDVLQSRRPLLVSKREPDRSTRER